MTLAMPDSITVGDLPPGYDAYMGYVDGDWPTGPELVRLFPGAHQVILTVTGRTTSGCNGCDVENGDLDPVGFITWLKWKLATAPKSRPVVYADLTNMFVVEDTLSDWGVQRSAVRLLSAHYTDSAHVCAPGACGEIQTAMDGTQWTASYRTAAGALVDMSMLADDFFTPGGK